MNEENASIEPASKQEKTVSARALAFLKDWGPPIAVIYAVFYTFPIEISDRFFTKPATDNLSSARKAIGDALLVQEEWNNKIRTANFSADPWGTDFLNSSYFYKVQILIDASSQEIGKSKESFSISELTNIGNLYARINEFEKAIEFYQEVLDRPHRKNIEPPLLPALGSAQFRTENSNLFSDARRNYIESLRMYADGKKRNYTNSTAYYFTVATDLAHNEAYVGDFKCAMEIAAQLDQMALWFPSDGYVNQTMNNFRQSMQQWSKLGGQSELGCKYELPPLT